MQISINDLFNSAGKVQDIWSLSVSGHRNTLYPTPGVTLLEQSVCVSKSIQLLEEAKSGLYISLYSTSTDNKSSHKKRRCQEKNDCIQISYLPRRISGSFPLQINTKYELTQLYIAPERCATLTNEPEEKIMSYFIEAAETLGSKNNVITIPITEQLRKAIAPILNRSFGGAQSIALTGKIYNLFFEVLEHLQITKHINDCENCQNKVLNGQNLIEAENSRLCIEKTADRVGLNRTAFELGFFHLVGQSAYKYQKRVQIKRAAQEIKNTPENKQDIITDTGLSIEEFEEAFLKQFGILSQYYGQIH